jgi:predicted DNA-binding transcriptional regulator AlpA
MAGMDERELVTLAEVARRVGLSPQRIGQLAQRPDFPERRKLGHYWLVDAAEVERWLRERPRDKGGRPRKQRPASPLNSTPA